MVVSYFFFVCIIFLIHSVCRYVRCWLLLLVIAYFLILFCFISVGLVSFYVDDCDCIDKLNWSLTLTKSNSYTLDLLTCFVRRKKFFYLKLYAKHTCVRNEWKFKCSTQKIACVVMLLISDNEEHTKRREEKKKNTQLKYRPKCEQVPMVLMTQHYWTEKYSKSHAI